MVTWLGMLTLLPLCLGIRTDRMRVFSPWIREGYNLTRTSDACASMGGTCQNDGLYCRGSYFSNMCPGAFTQRCCTKTIKVRNTGDCNNVIIASRDSWGARRSRSASPMKTPIGDFFIHHTDTPPCINTTGCVSRVKSIQNYHMDYRNWSDIAYSFLVGEDGMVYEGRGWNTVGAHTLHYNFKSLAASMIGNFSKRVPNEAALTAVKALIKCGVVQTRRIRSDYSLFGHRDVGNTDCPGAALYKNMSSWHNFHKHKP